METYRETSAQIHLDAIAHNYHVLKSLAKPGEFFCPMVKANAYGHGDVEVAERLQKEGCEAVGVVLLEEGLKLREAGLDLEILVFGVFDDMGAEDILEHRLTPVVSTWRQLQALERVVESTMGIHVKFDTGMHRIGFHAEEAVEVFDYLSKSKKFKLHGLCTHLFNADDFHFPHGRTQDQLRVIEKLYSVFSPLKPRLHTMNSLALLSRAQAEKSGESTPLTGGARPGIALYGLSPSSQVDAYVQQLDLRPTMSLHTRVVRYHELKPGQSVSYGGTFVAQKPSLIAVLPIGYADGYPRTLSNKGTALFAGKRVPVVGTVCMDYMMIDVTGLLEGKNASQFAEEHFGQLVTLFGRDEAGNILAADDLAQKIGTINYEIVARLGQRVPRQYTG